MNRNGFHKLLSFLTKLEAYNIPYALSHYRENSLMVTVSVPGERWEIEFLDDNSVEVEKFLSDGEIYEEGSLQTLFDRYLDQERENIPFPRSSETKVAAL